jgi:ADP-ribosyl-[dinitrogen reductase] hydrolase
MALCLADSLLARGGLDGEDLLRRFLRWYREGENACRGAGTGVSPATRAVLERFERTGRLDAAAALGNAGNGCIMRLAPVAIRWHRDPAAARAAAEAQARLTHTAAEAVAASGLLAALLVGALAGGGRARLAAIAASETHRALAAIADGRYRHWARDAVSSAPGAVATLEAALWCIEETRDFEAAVVAAVNLGGDADTIGAVTGQLAGALYGVSAIPLRWRERLHSARRLAALALRLYRAAP